MQSIDKTSIQIDTPYHKGIDSFIDSLRESQMEASLSMFNSEQTENFVSNIILVTDDSISAQYHIPPLIKNFLLLVRDSKLEFEKAKIQLAQDKIEKQDFNDFTFNLFTNTVSAAVTLKSNIYQQFVRTFSALEIEKMEEIISPWPTFQEQFEKIVEQIILIESSYEELTLTYPKLEQLAKTIKESIQESEASYRYINSAINILEDLSKKTNLKVKDLHKIYLEINSDIQDLTKVKINLDYLLDDIIQDLPEGLRIPISGSRGHLVVKDILLQKNIKEWLQIEILPEIYEIWELNDELINKLKSNSDNIANRINIALSSEDEDFNSSFFSNTINRLKKETELNNKRSNNLEFKVLSRLETELRPEFLLSDQNLFISSNWGSAIDTSTIDESPVFKNVKTWFKKLVDKTTDLTKNLFDENESNTFDHLIQYLRECKRQKYSEYNSIFLTKSFSGKSFYIPRSEKHNLANNAIDNWLDGFGNGLIIKGNRFSGKSSFAQAIASERTMIQSIDLHPQSEILFKGRKFKCDHNLTEALNFLKKHHNGEKVMVIVDDLFKWQNKQNNLISNIKALLKFIDYNQTKFFVITTMDEFQLNHFDKNLSLSSTITTQISVDQIKIEEFYKVIDVRHGATHKNLVLQNGQSSTPDVVKKYIKLVHREAEGNIGDALRIWAMSVIEHDNDQVSFDLFKVISLPDFLNEDNMIVLKAIGLHREITEYQLRTLLGPSFNSKYRNILMRLINVGVIERDIFNNLIYSEIIANQLLDKLKREGYL